MPMRISSNGRITIPKHIRDAAGIEPGCEVDFFIEEGRVHLIKRRQAQPKEAAREQFERHLREVTGILPRDALTADRLIEMTRGPGDDVDGS